jgi:hypothetical protein
VLNAVAGASENGSDVGPGIDTAASAGFDDAQGGRVGRAALLGSCAETEAASDHRQAQGTLGIVVRGRQMGIAHEGDDRIPVVEVILPRATGPEPRAIRRPL